MNIHKILFSKITNSYQLDIFRILWSFVMFIHFLYLFFSPRGDLYFFNSVFHFRYPFFEWLPIFPDSILKLIIFIGLMCSISLALGLFYKRSSFILFLSYTYLFLIDVSYWNNHYYLFALFNLFFIFTNFKGKFSLDFRFRNKKEANYSWQILLFKFQIALVYFFGGISKLSNPEWLNFKSVHSIYTNRFLTLGIEIVEPWFHYLVIFITIFGLAFDLIVPFLLFSRNKIIITITFLVVTSFHLSNIFLLEIGLFPYAMIASLVLFLPYKSYYSKKEIPKKNKLLKTALVLFFIIQFFLPIRHYFIKGNVFWTSEGKLYAWHMMSGSTEVICKNFKLIEKDDLGNVTDVHSLNLNNFLNKKQIRTIGHMPILAPQFFQFLKTEAELTGMQNVSLKGNIIIERNKKEYRYIISPKKDLTKIKYNPFKHNEWILLYKDEYF